MPANRKKLVEQAYQKIVSDVPLLYLSDLVKLYNAKKHPDTIKCYKTEK